MSYFISQEQDRGWRVDAEQLIARLRERWPEAEVETIADPARKYSHQWSIQTEGGAVEGMINRKGTSLVVDAPPESVAAFASWLQNDVLETDRALLLYDQEFLRVVPLKPGITPDQIVAVLRS